MQKNLWQKLAAKHFQAISGKDKPEREKIVGFGASGIDYSVKPKPLFWCSHTYFATEIAIFVKWLTLL